MGKAGSAYDEAKKQTNAATNVVGDKASGAKDTVAGAYDQATHKVGEAYDSAKKNTIGESPKAH